MDIQVVIFDIAKKVIQCQNEELLERISTDYGLNADTMKNTYTKPEFYLPVFEKLLEDGSERRKLLKKGMGST